MERGNAIATPCRQVCVLDPLTGLCIGCGRTGEEIAAWLALSAEARAAVMAVLPERLRAMTTRQVRGRRHVAGAAG